MAEPGSYAERHDRAREVFGRFVPGVAPDRVFASMEAQRQTRGQHMAQALALFEADTLDPAQLAAFAAQHEAEHKQMADVITQAIGEVHDVLNPIQRRAVADWIRTHRPGSHG